MPLFKKHPYFFTDNIQFRQKAVIMHPYKNMFLIMKRPEDDLVRPGTWDLPGGNVAFGEQHREALRREIDEETRLTVIDLKEIMVSTHYDVEKKIYYLVIGSFCRAVSERVTLSDEHTDYVWIHKDEFLTMDPTWSYQEERKIDFN